MLKPWTPEASKDAVTLVLAMLNGEKTMEDVQEFYAGMVSPNGCTPDEVKQQVTKALEPFLEGHEKECFIKTLEDVLRKY